MTDDAAARIVREHLCRALSADPLPRDDAERERFEHDRQEKLVAEVRQVIERARQARAAGDPYRAMILGHKAARVAQGARGLLDLLTHAPTEALLCGFGNGREVVERAEAALRDLAVLSDNRVAETRRPRGAGGHVRSGDEFAVRAIVFGAAVVWEMAGGKLRARNIVYEGVGPKRHRPKGPTRDEAPFARLVDAVAREALGRRPPRGLQQVVRDYVEKMRSP
jgi:hypothetical protein